MSNNRKNILYYIHLTIDYLVFMTYVIHYTISFRPIAVFLNVYKNINNLFMSTFLINLFHFSHARSDKGIIYANIMYTYICALAYSGY